MKRQAIEVVAEAEAMWNGRKAAMRCYRRRAKTDEK